MNAIVLVLYIFTVVNYIFTVVNYGRKVIALSDVDSSKKGEEVKEEAKLDVKEEAKLDVKEEKNVQFLPTTTETESIATESEKEFRRRATDAYNSFESLRFLEIRGLIKSILRLSTFISNKNIHIKKVCPHTCH